MAEDEAAPGSQDQAAELAKQLENPVACMISVPFHNDFDFDLGPHGDGLRYTLNFQPVIPISLNKDHNLIICPMVPIIDQNDIIAPAQNAFKRPILQTGINFLASGQPSRAASNRAGSTQSVSGAPSTRPD